MSTPRGKFITFDGLDGAGKSSQIEATVRLLESHDLEVVRTREPGGTDLAEKVRQLLLSEPMNLRTEVLLFFAARQEHLVQKIYPALARGAWVISDRFVDASFAYQVGGRGLIESDFQILEDWVCGHFKPDLTFIFDLAPQIAAERIAKGRQQLDRFEKEDTAFFTKVREAYLKRAKQDPDRCCVIDSDRPVEEVTEEVLSIVHGHFLT